ncbi:low temperature requirement C - like protein [Pyrococcus sp. NA2]|uniref:alpha-ribazole phosphatase CobZ n=1 Tax=Pyrococcus sp. (strain NA2) TaxID=342949 RepID=UPI000209A99B|nr:alpha-ribazole phosphatase CobZ [Pyrococcus sp. NA2]AEC51913.1 low temperature requirement C - like protein [Pyrococcus sp. NA2]
MDVIRILEDRGITLEKMIETALALYIGDDAEGVREELRGIMLKYLGDINVQALILSAILLEENFEVEGDPVNLVADELIGISIAEYIGGKMGLFNFFYYDTRKPGILRELPPFLDDAIGGFIAGCMTRLFQERRGNEESTLVPDEDSSEGRL